MEKCYNADKGLQFDELYFTSTCVSTFVVIIVIKGEKVTNSSIYLRHFVFFLA